MLNLPIYLEMPEYEEYLARKPEMKNIVSQAYTFSESSGLEHIESCGEIRFLEFD